MIRFFRVVKSFVDVLRKAPGEAIIVQVKTGLGEDRVMEYYQLPGISAAPTPQDRVATVSVDGYQVAIASNNYKIEVNTAPGGLTLYSTDATGDTIQAKIDLDGSGNISLNGEGRTLVTHAELDTALQGLILAINSHTHTGVQTGSGASGPPAAPASIDISAANAATLKTG